jgi:hypothetical protein
VNQQEPSTETGGLGERRRRREAERAARLAAEQTGKAQALTRRELRHRQLEEQARLEAIATGELPLVDDEGRPLAPEAAARMATAQPRPSSQPPAPSAEDRVAGSAGLTAESGPTAASSGEAQRAARLTAEPPRTDASPAAPAALSRRSLRDRVQTDAAVPEDGPAERTATSRRPVVRAPHAAKGIRTLDSTGTLTGVQPVEAPAAPPARRAPAADEPPVTTDPAGWESAVGLPAVRDDSTLVIDTVPGAAGGSTTPASAASAPGVPEPLTPAAPAAQPDGAERPPFAPVRREPTEAERARSAASPGRFPSAVSGPEAVAAAAFDEGAGADHDEDYDDDARPQWASLAEFSAVSSQSPDEPAEPARRSVRERMGGPTSTPSAPSADGGHDQAEYVDEIETRNPAASLVKIIALVLVAIVIGLLIGLLAFNQGDDGASMRIQSLAQAASAVLGSNP